MKRNYNVLIVDSHSLTRNGLKELIKSEKDIAVCCEAENALQALQIINDCKPDIIIVEIALEGVSGMQLIENLSYSHFGLLILVNSIYDEMIYAERCLKAGARGFIMKKEPSEKLITALRKVLHGEIFLSDALAGNYLEKLTSDRFRNYNFQIDNLSSRELEVYRLVGQRFKRKEIADMLHLSTKTIDNHFDHIKNKMKLKDSCELYIHAFNYFNEIIK